MNDKKIFGIPLVILMAFILTAFVVFGLQESQDIRSKASIERYPLVTPTPISDNGEPIDGACTLCTISQCYGNYAKEVRVCTDGKTKSSCSEQCIIGKKRSCTCPNPASKNCTQQCTVSVQKCPSAGRWSPCSNL
jgi:hypothetical protein